MTTTDDRRPLAPAQLRALSLGAELDRVNLLRDRRARVMASAAWGLYGPADRARYLLDLAGLDARRRMLRGLLGDQLGDVELAIMTLRGRHHARP